MDKECQNCEYSHIIKNERGFGECYCYAQKNSRRVDALGNCNFFKIKNSMDDTKSRYSYDEIKNLQDKIEEKYYSHCIATHCKECQYGETDTSCRLMFALDYLNEKGLLRK